MVMLAVDFLLGILATALEFRYWGAEGFSPDIAVSYVAVIPQVLLGNSYLLLARDMRARGLWKSVAGMLASYMLMCLLGLVILEILPDAGDVAVMALAAGGIVGLICFCVSDIPRIESEGTASRSPVDLDDAKRTGKLEIVVCIVGFIVMLGIKGVIRRFIAPFFRGFVFDDWVLLELLIVGLFGLSFAIWFAVAEDSPASAAGKHVANCWFHRNRHFGCPCQRGRGRFCGSCV